MACIKSTAPIGIASAPVHLDRSVYIGLGDSSWASADDFNTQLGSVLIFVDKAMLAQPTVGSMHEYKTDRAQRVVRSTLSGKAAATY